MKEGKIHLIENLRDKKEKDVIFHCIRIEGSTNYRKHMRERKYNEEANTIQYVRGDNIQ